jgi:hypothetical protein
MTLPAMTINPEPVIAPAFLRETDFWASEC